MSNPLPHFSAYPLEDFRRSETEILAATAAVMQGGHYILGTEVARFEEEFATFCGASYALGVANGTDAIELLLLGLDLGPGDAVAVPSHTAVASISAIRRTGADPVFVDIDPDSFTMAPSSLEAAIAGPAGHRIKAVLAVHLYGHPADLPALAAVCTAHGLALLEDCAQAHGATIGGRPVGSLARGGAFSFYPTKNLGGIGDGGAITTNDGALMERMREIRQYGWRERYISAREGVNSRLDELQAAILRVKLPLLATNNQRRRELAAHYRAALAGNLHLTLPAIRSGCGHVFHLHVIRTPHRDELMAHLLSLGFPVALHYPAAVHQQPAYASFAKHSPPLPQTERTIREILTLPLHSSLSEDAVEAMSAAINRWEPRPSG